MSRALKTSGFFGLAVMMSVGLYQVSLLAGGGAPPGWMVGMHAHLGVLSILAIVTGFAVDSLAVSGRARTLVTGFYVVGQWMLPGSIFLGEGLGLLVVMPTMFLWGAMLIIAMLTMAWQSFSADATGRTRGAMPADD